MKKLLWVFLALLVIGSVFIWRVVANLDTIVAGMIEESGSQALGTKVSVTGVQLDLRDGRATIAGLTIANPEGWSDPYAFELDRVSVAIDLQSLSSPVFVLKGVDVDASRAAYELRADGYSNLQELLDGMEPPSGQKSEPEAGTEPVLLRVEQLSFDGLYMAIRTPSIEAESGFEKRELSLPALEMTNIGGAQGAPPEAIAAAIGEQMVAEMLNAAAREGVDRLIDRQKDKIGERLGEQLKDLIDRD